MHMSSQRRQHATRPHQLPPPAFALPDTLAFQRRPARSPSSSRRAPAPRSAHASPARASPSVAQIPLPSKFATAPQPQRQQQQPRRPRKVLDLSYDGLEQDSRPPSPPLLSVQATNNFVDPQRGRADKVYTLHSTYHPDFPPASSSYSSFSSSSPRTKASRLPLWNAEDKESPEAEEDADIPDVLKQSKQWQALMSAPKPSPKGKEKATERNNLGGIRRDHIYTGAGRGRRPGPDSNDRRGAMLSNARQANAPQIAVVSATYQAQSPLQAGARPSYFDQDDLSSRSKSLSPIRDSSSSPSSSSSSSSRSSRTSSPSSSTSTLVTDPDPSPRASPSSEGAVVVGAECQSPRCFRTRELSLTVEESDNEAMNIMGGATTNLITFPTTKSTSSLSLSSMAAYGTPSAYVRVKLGRDPLSRGPTRLDMSDLLAASASSEKAAPEVVEQSEAVKSKAAKITSLLFSALDALANLGVGQIMVDGYSTGTYDEYPEKRRRRIERDSLGLEKATLSPGSPTSSPSLLFVAPGTPAPNPTQSPANKSPVRPRNHSRRRSLRHVSSDPILYHHHARAPSIQKRKQAFGPLDIKPYGYPPAIVALQRYPIIPYNPPGPGFSAEEEPFPKFRDLSKGRLWYLDLIPGGSDGKIDGDVPLSYEFRDVDDVGVLFTSFPDPLRAGSTVGTTHYGLKQAQYVPARRRPSEGERRRAQRSRSPYADRHADRARSPSPQRGRPRTVRPVTGSQHIRIPAQLKPLSPSPPPTPSPRARALTSRPLSSKHFRAPSLADQPSMYLLWALKGSILALPPSAQGQVDAMMEGWNGVVVRKGGNSSRKAGGSKDSARSGPAGAEGLRGTAKRRVGEDGRVWSALRWEVPVYGPSDFEDEDVVPGEEDGERV
ncbi:hypothetical protein FRC00_004741 [Tulasnella sp. 408]|nr:hypothetical protein FRC00_004741 [Tulasnella sp. 408]